MSSQMSVHDEIKEQRQKTKDMSIKGKLGYFWCYYKVHTLVAVAVIGLFTIGIYQYVTNKDFAFYAAIINADITRIADDPWGEEFSKYAEIDTEKYQAYFDTTVNLADNATTQYSMASVVKLVTMIQNGTVDIIVADTETFEEYAQRECFLNLEAVLPADVLAKYQDYLYYTDAATFNAEDDDTFYTEEEQTDSADYVIDHHDPSTMEDPIAVGICLSKGNKLTDTGCYDYLAETNTTYQGYPSEAILGIPYSSTKLDTSLKFLTFIEE